MINNILEMLKHAEQYESNEIISIAKGKFEMKKTKLQLLKDLLLWRLRK